ncbi:MAG: isopenicillin N synthase family oxygenase [Saprospiraceae bacterium]|jgi:isopenicillin N synthase-like dioxygenase|nr:isopenicillin N synthase family oxygenase [Saprospiraceae bacterium]MBK7795975.1 isopenicillin N synthase family oxygenase [Saprospiraceae bacterium]MBL0261087.1 isopenicillin N synthase family oxygenase [Saprospiraceae bacterium]MBX7163826.1 isopenicillin N synthase family oxygenase [Saprospiraceae bacterium]
MSTRSIPLVDLDLFVRGSQSERADFVSQLGAAFHNIGFVGVINHGIPQDLVTEFYNLSKDFFSLPNEIKLKYEVPGLAGQRGYTSFGKEHARQSKVGDLKEFFQIGQSVVDGDAIQGEYPDNVQVHELPFFSQTGNALYKSFERSGSHLLRAISLHLGLEEDFFNNKIHNGNSILRAIHYPPIIHEPDSAIRSEQHEDINLITLLVGASAGGLQVLNKQNEWLDVVPQSGEIVVNVGDMLQRLTNNYLKSTTHRVVNPPRAQWHTSRLSIPFFLHPRSEMDLSCLASCISDEKPLAYTPITAGEYLDERLREIGLKK